MTRRSWSNKHPWKMLFIGIFLGIVFTKAYEYCIEFPIQSYRDQVAVKNKVIDEIATNCKLIQLYYASLGGLPETRDRPWRPLIRLYTPFYNSASEKIDLIDNEKLKNEIRELYKKYNDVIARADYLIAEDRFNSLMSTKGIDNVSKFRAEIGDPNMDFYKKVVEQNNDLIKKVLRSLGNDPMLMATNQRLEFSEDWSKEEILRETLKIYKPSDSATGVMAFTSSKRLAPIVFR